MAMRFDVDDDLIALGGVDDPRVDAAHVVESFAFAHGLGFEAIVGGVDAGTPGNVGPTKRPQHVFDSERRAFGTGERKCRIELGKLNSEFLHLPAQRERVFPEGDVRLIAETVNPRHAVDDAALDEMNVVVVRPVQALVKAPVGTVESVGMKADLHKGFESVVGRGRPIQLQTYSWKAGMSTQMADFLVGKICGSAAADATIVANGLVEARFADAGRQR